MGIPIGPAVTLGTTALGAIFGRPKKKKTINLRALIDRYLAMRPGGYVTAEDKAASERTRSRLAGAAGESARGRRIQSRRAVTARGLAGSPADLAADLAITQDEALGRQGAAEQAAAQEYDAYSSNRGYNQGMVARALGLEAGAEMENARLDSAREAEFWNSILSVAPTLGQYFSPAAQPSTATAPGTIQTAVSAPGRGSPGGLDTPGSRASLARPASAVRAPVASSYQPRTRIPTYRTRRLLPAF